MNTNGIRKVEKTFEIKVPVLTTKSQALMNILKLAGLGIVSPGLAFGGWLYYSEKCEAVRMLLRLGGKKIGLVECALYDVMILPTIVLLGSGVFLLAGPVMLWAAFALLRSSFFSKSHSIMLLPTTLQVPEILLPKTSSLTYGGVTFSSAVTGLVIRSGNSTSVPYADIKTVSWKKHRIYGRNLRITRNSGVDLILPLTLFQGEAELQLLEKMLLASIESVAREADGAKEREEPLELALGEADKSESARREAVGAIEREVPWRERLSAMKVNTSVEIEGLVLWKRRDRYGNEYFSGIERYVTVDQVMNAYRIS